jgi:hypothetical protein
MALYCPNCSAQLKSTNECWNCEAIFGDGTAWAATDRPIGIFKQRTRPVRSVAPTATTSDVQLGVLGKILLYLLFLPLWLLGGLFMLGPALAPSFENVVGRFIPNSTALFWAILPITALVALIKPARATGWTLVANLVIWLGFLAALYAKLNYRN